MEEEIILVSSIFCFAHYGFKNLVFTCLQYKPFENTEGKGEIACNEQFLLFLSVFYVFEELSANFIKFAIVFCKLFQFGRVLKFVIWEQVN